MASPAFSVRIGLCAMLLGAGPAAAADAVKTPTFTKDVAPIFQAKCEACHRPDSIAPMSLVDVSRRRGRGRESIKTRVAARQMPPWHIDKTVGIQKFKNDRSLTDAARSTRSSAGSTRGAPEGRPEGHAGGRSDWPDESSLELRRDVRRPAGPRHQVAAVHDAGAGAGRVVQAGRRRRASPNRVGFARSRSGRPTVKGRKIVHHALARLQQDDRSTPRPPRTRRRSGDQRGPGSFMEWAVGKQGEMMRPDTGKLLLPGSKIIWDIHYSAGRRGDHRQRRARHLPLSEGAGAEVSARSLHSDAAAPAASTSRPTPFKCTRASS